MRFLSSVILASACLAVLLPQLASLRLVACQRDESCTNPDAAAANADSSPAGQARSYDKILGSSQRGARYQFRPEQHYVFEGAQILLDAGLSSFKFKLQPESAAGVLADSKKPLSMLEVLKSKDFPYQSVLDLPFRAFHIVIGEHEQRNLSEEEVDWYNQVYELASYLIKRYTGSGKTFFLAAEQGDLQMRQQPTGKAAAAAAVTAATPLDAERQEMLGKMWWEQQAAVDDARVDAADKLKGVQVFSYLEMNFMKNDTVDFTVIDDIIPALDPTPDYVGVSLSSLPDYTQPADVSSKIIELLDYVAGKLPEKEGVQGPRVLISEAAFPTKTAAGAADEATGTQELQARRALAVAAAAIAWGTPSISYSSLYDSTATAKNTAAARMLAGAKAGKGVYEDTGVALVDKDGKDTVLCAALKGFATQANTWLEAQIEANKETPCKDHFRAWAVEALTAAANEAAPTAGKLTAPSVTFRYGCKELVAKS